MEQLKTNWESIGLSNDFLFGKIMRKPALCKRMLEIILGVKIDHLEYLESQKSIDEEWDARSIRLDIYVQDNREVVYNIEIQTTNTGDLPKRSRYYQSVLDMQQLNKGERYKNLKRTYIIFICTFDLFKMGRHVYTFENQCREDGSLRLEDDTYKLFLNTEGVMYDVSTDLKAFLDYMGGRPSDHAFVKVLNDEVTLAKHNKEWRREYMTLLMRDQENIDKGREQGLKEGREQGLEEGREQGLKEGREQGLEEGREQGLEEGREKGEGRFAELTQRLLQDKRYIDLEKSATDPEYRQKLYEEYRIL